MTTAVTGGSTPPFLFEISPPVQTKLAALKSCKLNQFGLALRKVKELGEILKIGEGFSPIARGRAQFIQSSFQEAIDKTSGSSPEVTLIQIMAELINIKNALQVEALFFGSLYPIIAKYHDLYSNPQFFELTKAIPNIFKCIQTNMVLMTGYYTIDLESLAAYFDLVGIQDAEDLFDGLMFSYLVSCELSADRRSIRIPFGTLPMADELAPYFRSPKLVCKHLAEILYILRIEEDLILNIASSHELNEASLEMIGKKGIRQYHEKRALLPYLATLIEARAEVAALYATPMAMLTSPEFIRKIDSISPTLWLEESADVFELSLKIECYIRKVFPSGCLVQVDHRFFTEGCDGHVKQLGDFFKSQHSSDVRWLFPVTSDHPFCVSREEFLHLALCNCPISGIKEKRVSIVEEKPRKLSKEELAKQKKSKSKVKKPPVVSTAEGSEEASGYIARLHVAGTETAGDPELDLTRLVSPEFLAGLPSSKPHSTAVAGSGSSAVCSKASSAPTCIVAHSAPDSLALTRAFLTDVRFERRVSDFWESIESGLSHRNLDPSEVGYEAKVAQLVRTHDFPVELLLFACNPAYSNASVWGDPGRLEHNHFSSCIYIDGVKHKLTVAFNRVKSCYHFSASPIQSWMNYFDHELPVGEFPTLSEALDPSIVDPSAISAGAYTLDASRNATFAYRGRSIKIVRLK